MEICQWRMFRHGSNEAATKVDGVLVEIGYDVFVWSFVFVSLFLVGLLIGLRWKICFG